MQYNEKVFLFAVKHAIPKNVAAVWAEYGCTALCANHHAISFAKIKQIIGIVLVQSSPF